MPTTLTGLVLFLVLLVPGFAFVGVRRRSRPDQRVSVFHETASVAIASAAALAFVLTIVGAVRTAKPESTPDIGQLVRDGREYIQQEYAMVGLWAAGALAGATVLAGLAGWAAGKWLPIHPSQMSSWWVLFDHRRRERSVEVGCGLDDGTYIQGKLKSYSMLADDIEDRDLVLSPPISIRMPGRKTLRAYEVSGICLSARKIVWMSASLVEIPESDPIPEAATNQNQGVSPDRRRPEGHSGPSQKEARLGQPVSESP